MDVETPPLVEKLFSGDNINVTKGLGECLRLSGKSSCTLGKT
jgi:hypothetical protein